MPWIIGIDEAGYGPNLGPLVMTSVACRVPESLAGADLWDVLRPAVRRHGDAEDERLLVADSKVVYSPGTGLEALETVVLAASQPELDAAPLLLGEYLGRLAPAGLTELAPEPWYGGESTLPAAAETEACRAAAERFTSCSGERAVAWPLIRSVIVCPPRFNALVQRWNSKGAVLGHALTELIQANRAAADAGESLAFAVDKHGGRNTYAPMLQDAIPDGWVLPQEEGMARSAYQVAGASQPLRFTFQPRADAEHFCVALASMVSKYLREVLMREFNRYWQAQVPGLKATAGYPGDAARFLEGIRPALDRLGIAEAAVWRCR